MNERIRKLYENSHKIAVTECYYTGMPQVSKEFDPEIFAKSIVQECLDLVIAHEDDAPEHFHNLWLHMKTHFGVN